MDKASRVNRIRTRERHFASLRSLVVPVCLVYGLFIQRPKQYNFTNYISSRRKYDAEFNALFPQLPKSQRPSGVYTRVAELSNGSGGTREVVGRASSELLISELNAQVEGFYAQKIDANETASPVQLFFQSYLLFAVGTIVLTSTAGEVKRLRYAGVLGSFWLEV